MIGIDALAVHQVDHVLPGGWPQIVGAHQLDGVPARAGQAGRSRRCAAPRRASGKLVSPSSSSRWTPRLLMAAGVGVRPGVGGGVGGRAVEVGNGVVVGVADGLGRGVDEDVGPGVAASVGVTTSVGGSVPTGSAGVRVVAGGASVGAGCKPGKHPATTVRQASSRARRAHLRG